MSKRSSMGLLVAMAVAACGGEANESASRVVASAVTVPSGSSAPSGPRLLRHARAPGTGAPVSYAVALPQEGGGRRLVGLDASCTEAQMRGLFGLWKSPIEDSDDPAFAGPLPTVTCPDGIAGDATVYVEPRTRGVSYLEASRGADGRAPTYFVIPNRCLALMSHFRVVERGRAHPPSHGGGEVWTPPADADSIRFSCANETPPEPYAGWKISWVEGYTLASARQFFLLQRGDVAMLVDAVDGVPLDTLANTKLDVFTSTLERLATAFSVPTAFVGYDWYPLGDTEQERALLAGPLVDVCLDRCDDPSWTPSHKHLADGALSCGEGALDESQGCPAQGRFAVVEQRLLDGSVRRHVRLPGKDVGLPVGCAGSDGWERRLGLAARPLATTWLASMVSAYEDAAATPVGGSLELACPKDAPPCRVAVRDGADLSTVSLPDLVARSCKRTDTAVDVVLGKLATVKGRPFTIAAGALPTNVRTVRVLGAASGSTLAVDQPKCGFGSNAVCTDPVAAFSIQGDLTVELSRLTFVAVRGGSETNVPPSVARIGIAAAGGAANALDLRARDVHVGTVQGGPFYRGVTFTGGSLALYGSDVRAFTHAVTADQARVSIVGAPGGGSEIASLAQAGLAAAQLKDLRGASLAGSVDNFRALTLGGNVQAFVANATVSGPLAVAWSNDRLDYGERGLWSIATTFTNGSDHFARESVLLATSGRGSLYFYLPVVSRFGSVLRCPSRPWPTAPDVVPHIVLDLAAYESISHPLRAGLCRFESASTWTPEEAGL